MTKELRVGRITFKRNGERVQPNNKINGKEYKRIQVMTGKSKQASLSPYNLKDDNGVIIENLWQFSKVYEKLPKVTQKYSRWNDTEIWNHEGGIFYDKDNNRLLPDYFKWRNQGFQNNYAIRYPAGYSRKDKVLFAVKESNLKEFLNEEDKLDYIQSRKEIYLPEYCKSVRKSPYFQELKEMIQKEDIMITECDGPHSESMDYYKERYLVSDDFIIDDTVLCTTDNLKILLNDPKHPFGHGYCLAACLLGIDKEL